MEKYFFFYLFALVAEIIGTVSGFGSSILFVPLASLFFDFKVVLGITALFHVFSNLSKIFLFSKGIDKNIAFKLGVPAVIFVIVGALLSNIIPQKELELLMCVFILLLAIYMIVNASKTIESSNKNLITGGVVSGFLAGLIGTGGAIRGLTLAAFNLEKDIFIATSALIDLGVDSSRAVVYFFNGFIKYEYLFVIPILIVISILGSWIGKLILQQISQVVFKYIVLIVIVIASLIQVIGYVVKT